MKYTPTFKGTWCEKCGCEMDCRNCKYKDGCKSREISHEQYDYG